MSELLNLLSKLETNGTDPRIAGASGSASPEEACRAISFLPQPVQTVDAVPENIGSVGLDEIASTLWRRRLVLFAFVASGLALAILLSLFSKPVYRARTAIRLQMPPDPYAAVAIQSPASDLEGSSTSESYVQNEIKVLQSDSLAERVADRIDEEVPEKQERLPLSSPLKKLLAHFKRPETSSPEQARIRSFHQALTVHTSLKSQVVEIYFDSADPLRAATAANAVVSEYIAMNREAEIKSAQDRTEWLSSQISDLKTKLDRENQDLKAFASASGLIYSTNQSALAEQRVSELQTQPIIAQNQRQLFIEHPVVALLEEQPVFPVIYDFRKAANPGSNDGSTGSHRFETYAREVLPQTRQNAHSGGSQGLRNAGSSEWAGELDR